MCASGGASVLHIAAYGSGVLPRATHAVHMARQQMAVQYNRHCRQGVAVWVVPYSSVFQSNLDRWMRLYGVRYPLVGPRTGELRINSAIEWMKRVRVILVLAFVWCLRIFFRRYSCVVIALLGLLIRVDRRWYMCWFWIYILYAIQISFAQIHGSVWPCSGREGRIGGLFTFALSTPVDFPTDCH